MTPARLGQHWLIDKRVCQRIADTISLSKNETCIEIGGGKGALTRFIAPECRRLIVYEIDGNWAGHLRKFGPKWGDTIEVRELDALKINWDRSSLQIPPDETLIITGNLPFYITSPLLLRLAYSGLDFNRAIFLLQREVAERIAAKPSDSAYSRLTVSLGAFLSMETLFTVPQDAFKPRPRVMSALVKLTPHDKPLVDKEITDAFEKTVQVAFHMRRKTIKNNLLAGYPDKKPEEIDEILNRVGIKPNARPQEISVADFVTLTRMLYLPESG